MGIRLILSLSVFLLSVEFAFCQFVNHHNPLFQPNIPRPLQGTTYTDIKFGTYITRITDARAIGIPGIIPNYSKRQAWNKDESLMLLQTGSGIFRLYNGTNYQFVCELTGVEGEDVFWHPVNVSTIIYNPGNALYSCNVNTNQSTLIKEFSNYLWANTRGEGNLSNDGRYYAFVGRYTDTTFNAIHVYDFQTNSIISSMNLPSNLADFDWVSISPSGNYVVVDYADEVTGRYHGVEVYSRNLNFIWQKPLGAGHSDLGIDVNGDDILVMDIYNSDSNKVFFKKFKLSTGQETVLLSTSQLFYDHISCRNELRKDWCFVSTFDNPGRLTHDSIGWLSFEDEVFALKLDGSKQVQRIAHHHSRRFSPITPDPDNSVYWAEPHATVSRIGNRILWGSNWNYRVDLDSSVDSYVCSFSHFIGINSINENVPEKFVLLQNYPNPFNPNTIIRYQLPVTNFVTMKVYDALGKEIKTLVNEKLQPGTHEVTFDGSNLPSGIYLYQLSAEDFIETKRMIMIK